MGGIFRISTMNKMSDYIMNSSLVSFCPSERKMLLILVVLLKIYHEDCFTHSALNIKYITRFGSMGTVRNKGERKVS